MPHGEKAYYDMRPTIAVARPGAANGVVDLDGFFGLHPSLAPLKPLWDQKLLAPIQAVGSPSTSRSHFDAQDYMETGTPDIKGTQDGWLNRLLAVEGNVRGGMRLRIRSARSRWCRRRRAFSRGGRDDRDELARRVLGSRDRHRGADVWRRCIAPEAPISCTAPDRRCSTR